MKTIKLDAFYGDRKINEFMHFADVFESFKEIAIPHEIILDVSFDDDEVERAENTVNLIVDALQKSDHNVVFVSIKSIDNIPIAMKNYLKEGIAVISDGDKYVMFHEILTLMGYEVKTNDRMQVTEAKLITN